MPSGGKKKNPQHGSFDLEGEKGGVELEYLYKFYRRESNKPQPPTSKNKGKKKPETQPLTGKKEGREKGEKKKKKKKKRIRPFPPGKKWFLRVKKERWCPLSTDVVVGKKKRILFVGGGERKGKKILIVGWTRGVGSARTPLPMKGGEGGGGGP